MIPDRKFVASKRARSLRRKSSTLLRACVSPHLSTHDNYLSLAFGCMRERLVCIAGRWHAQKWASIAYTLTARERPFARYKSGILFYPLFLSASTSQASGYFLPSQQHLNPTPGSASQRIPCLTISTALRIVHPPAKGYAERLEPPRRSDAISPRPRRAGSPCAAAGAFVETKWRTRRCGPQLRMVRCNVGVRR